MTSQRDAQDGGTCRRFARRLRDDKGTAAIEFALLVMPLLVMILGLIQFAITLNIYVSLTSAVGVGARQFAISRGDATPMTDTLNQMYSVAPSLSQASLSVAFAVNGTSCTTDAACSSALAAGVPATVTATYPCKLTIMGTNYAPAGCVLTSKSTERVQ